MLSFCFPQIQELRVKKSSEMTQRKLPWKAISQVFIFVLLFSPLPAVGQFVLPFLYMPLKSLLPELIPSKPKHFKVTSEHVGIMKGWTLQQTYGETLDTLQSEAVFLVARRSFSDCF